MADHKKAMFVYCHGIVTYDPCIFSMAAVLMWTLVVSNLRQKALNYVKIKK